MPSADQPEPDHPDAIDVGTPDPNDELAVRIAADTAFERRSGEPRLRAWADRLIVLNWLAIMGIGIAIIAIGGWGAWVAGLTIIAIGAAMFWLRGHANRARRNGR